MEIIHEMIAVYATTTNFARLLTRHQLVSYNQNDSKWCPIKFYTSVDFCGMKISCTENNILEREL